MIDNSGYLGGIKITVVWDVMSCSLVHECRYWGEERVPKRNGSSRFLWNVGTLLPNYTSLHPTK